jgi:UDP-glucose 4-epimerase
MKIGITGAAGGVGSVLADALFKLDIETVLIDDLSSGHITNFKIKKNSDELNLVNVNDIDTVTRLFKDCNIIVHLAAVSSLASCQVNPKLAFSNNFLTTTVIGEISRKYGTKIIFASTSAVYENCYTFPLKEDGYFQPPTLIYPQTKYFSEIFLNGLGTSNSINFTNLRIFNVFGSNQDFRRRFPPLINHIVKKVFLSEDLVIYADINTSRDYVSVHDLIDLILILINNSDAGKRETFNVCSGHAISISDIIMALERGLNLKIPVVQGLAQDLWENEEQLFNGSHPLNKKVIRNETLKKSIGSGLKLKKHLDFSPKINVLQEIEEVAPFILESIKNYYH